jgi:adenine-specific DNA-methyltransferase
MTNTEAISVTKANGNIAKFDLQSDDNLEARRRELLRLFPEVHTESGGINFDALRLSLGDAVNSGPEIFGISWPGKTECARIVQRQSIATLLPVEKESVNWDSARHVFIEGDNLEVLKVLQKAYLRKVKMIYIDPPYNTGNDFIYPDNYTESLKAYLQYTGQVDSEGRSLSTNTESSGRFHSKWMNMMYPRIAISHNLLADDGLIFVSIDDSEFPRLITILNEIYGEENFVGTMIIEGTPKNDPKILSTAHEYCVCYAKDFRIAGNAEFGIANESFGLLQAMYEKFKGNELKLAEELELFLSNLPDDMANIKNYKDFDGNGIFRTGPIDDPQGTGPKDDRINPKTGKPCKTPNQGWRCNIETWNQWLAEDLIWFPDNDDQLPAKKTYATSTRREPLRALQKIQSRKSTQYLKDLFGTSVSIFPNPKPSELLDLLVELVTEPEAEEESLILDFFAGSGSLADVCLRKNATKKTKISTISIQLPEEIDPAKSSSGRDKKRAIEAVKFLTSIGAPPTISEILKERLRRVSKSVGGGFRSFKLDKSNFAAWDANTIEGDEKKLEQQLFAQVEHVLAGRNNQDILFELLLKSRYELTTKFEMINIGKCTVWKVADGEMFAIIEVGLTIEVIREIASWKPKSVVILDRCFMGDDSLKANARKIFEDSKVDLKTV